MLDVAAVALIFSFLLLIWLRTNAFAEYLTLFRLSRFFHIAEFNELHTNGYGGTYVDFLYEYYKDSFFVRLIACPICLSTWIGVLGIVLLDFFSGFLLAPLVLFFYLVLNKML